MSIRSTEKVNLHRRTLREFTSEDTIYITKNVRGFSYNYLCQFVKLEKGVVVGKVLDVDKTWGALEDGTILHSRANRCYLWGKFEEDNVRWNFCHWFKNLDSSAGA